MKPERIGRITLPIFIFFMYSLFMNYSVPPGVDGYLPSIFYRPGVPFFPGFALYILIGRIFTIIFSNVAIGANILSMFLGTFSSVIFYSLLRLKYKGILPLLWTLIFSFHPVIFYSSTNATIITPSIFLFLLMLYFYETKRERLLYYTAGLSLTFHPILYIPIVFFLLNTRRNLKKNIIFLVVGFSSCLYLLIMTFYDPLIDWGNLYNLKHFGRMVLNTLSLNFIHPFRDFPSSLYGTLLVAVKYFGIFVPFMFFLKDKKNPIIYLFLIQFILIPFVSKGNSIYIGYVFFVAIILSIYLASQGVMMLKPHYRLVILAFLLSLMFLQSYKENIMREEHFGNYLVQEFNSQIKSGDCILGDRLFLPYLIYLYTVRGDFSLEIENNNFLHTGFCEPNLCLWKKKPFIYSYGLFFSKSRHRIKWGIKTPNNISLYEGEEEAYGLFLVRRAAYLTGQGRYIEGLKYAYRAEKLIGFKSVRYDLINLYKRLGLEERIKLLEYGKKRQIRERRKK